MSEKSLLPVNEALLERGLDLALARFVDRLAPPFPELMTPADTPVEFLPYLAADRGVSEWSATAPESEKRLTVALAWPTKRIAGTRQALENAALGLELTPEVVAWYEQTPRGEPYSFTVRAFSSGQYSEEMDARLNRRIADAKAERDTLSVSIGLSAAGAHSIAAAAIFGEVTTIYPISLSSIESTGKVYSGLGYYVVEATTIYPQGGLNG